MFYAVVLAGGSGTRFWPKSRREQPKQLLDILGDSPLIALTIDRLSGLFSREQILVVTHQQQVDAVRKHIELDEGNVLTEPASRNTAAAIGLAAMEIKRRAGDDAALAVLPSDHYVADIDAFLKTLLIAKEVAQQGQLVTIGIRPRYPETGYGYIELGEPLEELGYQGVHRVAQFVEKPSLKKAAEYVESGDYSWNSGTFIWRAGAFLEAVRRHMPELHEGLVEIERNGFARETVTCVYGSFPDISVDYGIMERAENRAVVLAEYGWSDVGSWSALGELLEADSRGNVARGQVVTLDCSDSILYSDQGLLAAIGLHEVIVVSTRDAVLVCPKEKAQEVREMVKKLEEMGREEYL